MAWTKCVVRILLLSVVATLARLPVLAAADLQPVPAEDALERATKDVREVYADEYKKATRPAAKKALAETLFQLAIDTKDDPTTRFATLRIARDIGGVIGDVGLMRRAIDQLASEFQIDAPAMHLECLVKLDGKAPAGELARLAEYGTGLARQLAAKARYTEALKAIYIALEASKKAKLTADAKRLTAYRDVLAETEPVAAQVPKHRAVLKESPTDPDANLALGRFLCFYEEDWASGVSMLALGSDPELAKLAEAEVRGAHKGVALQELAESWIVHARAETPFVQANVKRHAAKLLWQAKSELSGLSSAKAQRRTLELVSTLPPSYAPVPPKSLHVVPGEHVDFAFSPDGQLVLTADEANTILLWDLDTMIPLREFKGHTGKVGAFAFFPDGSKFVSTGHDAKLRVWDVSTGEHRAVPIAEPGGHRLVVMPDARRVVRAYGAAYVTHDLGTGKELARHDLRFGAEVNVTYITPDGGFAIISGITNTVRVGDSKGKQVVFDGRTHCYDACLSPDGSLALTGGGDNLVRLWAIAEGGATELRTYKGNTKHVYGVRFSPDGRRVVSCGADGTIRTWDLHTGEPVQVLEGTTGTLHHLRISPDGRRAVARSKGNSWLVGLAQ